MMFIQWSEYITNQVLLIFFIQHSSSWQYNSLPTIDILWGQVNSLAAEKASRLGEGKLQYIKPGKNVLVKLDLLSVGPPFVTVVAAVRESGIKLCFTIY